METIAVLRYKRKELSFTPNSARGLNCREDRLLKSALGSIEKERQRSLSAIANEVQDIHVSLKETGNLRRHNSPSTLEVVDLCGATSDGVNTKKHDESFCVNSNKNNTNYEKSARQQPSHTDSGSTSSHFPVLRDGIQEPIKRILSRRHKISSGSADMEPMYTDGIPTHRVTSPSPIRRCTETKSRSSDNLDKNTNESIKLFHKRNATMKRTISADNLPSVMGGNDRHTIPVRRITFASYGTSPTLPNGFSPTLAGRQRKLGVMSPDSTPVLIRKGSSDKTVPISTIAGHQKVARMFSCPQLGRTASPLEKDFHMISSSKAGLPEIFQETQARWNSSQETSQTGCLSVSPKNSDGSYMDQNLQQRINAFLDSLPVNDDFLHNEDAELQQIPLQ